MTMCGDTTWFVLPKIQPGSWRPRRLVKTVKGEGKGRKQSVTFLGGLKTEGVFFFHLGK